MFITTLRLLKSEATVFFHQLSIPDAQLKVTHQLGNGMLYSGAASDFKTIPSQNIDGFSNEAKIGNQNTFYSTDILLYMLREYMVGYAQVWVTQK